MLRHVILATGAAAVALAASACSSEPSTTAVSTTAAVSSTVPAVVNPPAATVVDGLRTAGMPIGTTKQDSPANLNSGVLDRVLFIDTTISAPQATPVVEGGGAVEVLASNSEANKRADQVQSISADGQVSEYDYVSGNVVLRLSPALSRGGRQLRYRDALKAATGN